MTSVKEYARHFPCLWQNYGIKSTRFCQRKDNVAWEKQTLQFIVDTAFAGICEDWERQENGGFKFLLSVGSGVQIASRTLQNFKTADIKFT